MPSRRDSRSSVSRARRAVCGAFFHLKNVERPGEPSKVICSSALKSQSRAMLKNARRPAADMSAAEGSAGGRRRGRSALEMWAAEDIMESLVERFIHISLYMD